MRNTKKTTEHNNVEIVKMIKILRQRATEALKNGESHAIKTELDLLEKLLKIAKLDIVETITKSPKQRHQEREKLMLELEKRLEKISKNDAANQ
jgi:hypothetical protein